MRTCNLRFPDYPDRTMRSVCDSDRSPARQYSPKSAEILSTDDYEISIPISGPRDDLSGSRSGNHFRADLERRISQLFNDLANRMVRSLACLAAQQPDLLE